MVKTVDEDRDLSIEEILQQAEKVLEKTRKKQQLQEQQQQQGSEQAPATPSNSSESREAKPAPKPASAPATNPAPKVNPATPADEKTTKIFTTSNVTKETRGETVKREIPAQNTDKIKADAENEKTVKVSPIINKQPAKESSSEAVDNEKTVKVSTGDLLKDQQAKEVPSEAPGNEKTVVVSVPPSAEKEKDVATDATINVSASGKTFFGHDASKGDFNSAPPETIEKSAIIKGKSRVSGTGDLQEIPTLIAVDEIDTAIENFISGAPQKENEEKEEYNKSEQIKIDGFDDELGNAPEIDEAVAEQMLKKRRAEKVKKFRLFADEEVQPDKDSPVSGVDTENYTDRRKKFEFLDKLKKRRSSYSTVLTLTAILGALLLYLTLSRGTSAELPFLYDTGSYTIAVAAVYLVILLINIGTFIHAFNFKHGINYDFPVAVTAILVLAHSVAIYFMPELLENGGAFYSSSAVFLLFFNQLGRHESLTVLINNYNFLTSSGDKYSIEEIPNEVDASIIAKNLLTGEPLLKYSVKTDMPTSFLEISFANEPATGIARVLFPIMFVLNAALFAVTYFTQNDLNISINIFIAGLVISCPALALYSSNNSLKTAGRSLSSNKAMVCGFEGAHMLHNSNALVMEASDLFGPSSCELYGIKTFNDAKVDDAILYTAAVIAKTKSPLAGKFNEIIVGSKSVLPQVDDVVYEDKMGTSAWIYQKKILVGNRDLLIAHGVQVPRESYEAEYTKNGRKALYLAIAGKLSAMFIVEYRTTQKLKKELRKLERSGITILLRSCDPYINDETIKELFNLPEGFIRVMTAANARVFEKYSDSTVKKSPVYALHNGNVIGFIRMMRASDSLVNIQHLTNVLVVFGSALGFGIVALLGILNGINSVTEANLLLFQAVWAVFMLLIVKLRSRAI